MNTYTIQIGNSDNKLPQREWFDFITEVENIVNSKATDVHFSGGSNPRSAWQNYCWVFTINNPLDGLRKPLRELAAKYRQDSIAVTVGETEFVTP